MSISYANVTVKDVDQPAIVGHLKRSKRDAYVSPTVNGYTVVFDRSSEDSGEALVALALDLSEWFGCVALAALVHDGDLFMYWLYENGRLIDRYNSIPNYFDSAAEPVPPEGGNPRELARAFQAPDALGNMRDLFERAARATLEEDSPDETLVGDEIHDVLAQALSLPLFSVDTGYYSIVNNSLPDDLPAASLAFCGDALWL